MILIKSSQQDYSTALVAEWILFGSIRFEIISELDKIVDIYCTIQGGTILITQTGKEINLDEIVSYWYRRGVWDFEMSSTQKAELPNELKKGISTEWEILHEYLMLKLKNKKHLSSSLSSYVNKLKVLEIAEGLGILTPKTIVTTKRQDVLNFFDGRPIINKTIGDVISTQIGDFVYTNRTTAIIAEELPEAFFPSLFQEDIKKRYELRVFYLDGKFYSMAIFSQQDSQTKTDFRNYNYQNPNRNVPFKIPVQLEQQLLQLMQKLNLETGSIDIIVNDELEFIFLEVNPDGQFGMISYPCNYYLEKEIANLLKP